jgi:hypothetical protein
MHAATHGAEGLVEFRGDATSARRKDGLKVAVGLSRGVADSSIQLDVGAGNQVHAGFAREQDQVQQQVTVLGFDFPARLVGPADRKLVEQSLDVGKGYFCWFLGHPDSSAATSGI